MGESATIQKLEGLLPTRSDYKLDSPTEWLAGIDQATSLPDLDDIGSVFGSTRMSLESMAYHNA